MKLRILWWVAGFLAGGVGQAAEVAWTAAQQQLRTLTREWVDAESARDEVALRGILDERLVATFGTGAVVGKEDYVKAVMRPGRSKMTRHDFTDETVVVVGDTGVVVGTDTIHSVKDGAEEATSYRYTATYIRRGERWTVLALHMAKIAPLPRN